MSVSPTGQSTFSRRERVAGYVALTKPRIIELLLVTTVPTMFVAERSVPSVWLMVATVVGGTLAAGGANAVNMVVDRDIDGLMERTMHRPLVRGVMSPRAALAFAVVIEVVAFAWLFTTVNLLSALLAVSATFFYVFVYTLWLKRTTTQNIVIGGAAGAIPPMVGWAAVTGSLDLPALYLFTIVFFWTPPHFWALALMIQDDYQQAGVPMLPVVVGEERTSQNIFVYSLALVALTLLFGTSDATGLVYLASAAALGAIFIFLAWRLKLEYSIRRAKHLYLFSLLYLALLFSFMLADGVYRL